MMPSLMRRLSSKDPLMRFTVFLLFILLFCDDADSVLHELGL